MSIALTQIDQNNSNSSNGILAIEARDLNVYYDTFRAVKDVDIQIEARKITALIGPSGGGKLPLPPFPHWLLQPAGRQGKTSIPFPYPAWHAGVLLQLVGASLQELQSGRQVIRIKLHLPHPLFLPDTGTWWMSLQ